MLSPEKSRTALSPPVLAAVARFVVDRLGLVFAEDRHCLLARALETAAAESGFRDAGSYVVSLLDGPVTSPQLAVLAGHLTIGETYFFREPAGFAALQETLLGLLAARRALPRSQRQVRLWTAGCATGEEAYSIAMLLELELGLGLGFADDDQWDISLLATDINEHFLGRARRGLYRDWSFRGMENALKQRFFAPHPEGGFEIAPGLRRRVTFAALNLIEADYSPVAGAPGMDVILCRNVLIYFEASQARKVAARLIDSLGAGGILVTGTADAVLPCLAEHDGLEPLAPAVYRKCVARPAPPRLRALPLRPSTKQSAPPVYGAATTAPGPVDMVRLESQAREAVREGRQADAMRLAGEWLERLPTAAAPKLLLARLHADRGALSEASLWADRAIKADKADPGAHCLRASILIEMGQRAEAAKALSRALYLAPDFVPAHYGLGVLALGEGKESRARRHFDNALAILSERAPQDTVAELDGVSVRTLTDAIRSLRDSRLVGAAS